MESFELTFFFSKEGFDEESMSILKEILQKYVPLEKKALTELFSDEDKNFVEVRISLFDFMITKDSFKSTFNELSRFVSTAFDRIANISFATGIYELTYYLIENIKQLREFDSALLQKFPIVFLRSTSKHDFGQTIFSDDNVTCIFNEKAQNLY